MTWNNVDPVLCSHMASQDLKWWVTAEVLYLSMFWHYSDVIMGAIASQITSVSIVYSTVCSGADQRKHQSSPSLASVRGIHQWPVNSPHEGPVTRKMFPFDDVIMCGLVPSNNKPSFFFDDVITENSVCLVQLIYNYAVRCTRDSIG